MAVCETSLATSAGAIPKKNPSCNNTCTINTNLNHERPLTWQQRIFGKQLLQCNQINNIQDSAKLTCINVSNFININGSSTCEIIGVYFSFINSTTICDDFTKHLIELYTNVNSNDVINGEHEDTDGKKCKKFQVVHVVLWSNVVDVLDFDESFRNHVAELPWLAVPNQDYERKVKYYII